MTGQNVIFVGQTLLTFSLYSGYTDPVDACAILVEKPNGSKVKWPGTNTNGVITYDVANGDIDQAGTWKLQTWIQVGSKEATGDIVTQEVLETLK